jgi:HK97 family phage major capsid protein
VPVHVDPFVPAIATGAKSVIAGDWSRVFVRHVQDLRFERSDDYAFINDVVTFRGAMSIDSALIDATGLYHYVGAAT